MVAAIIRAAMEWRSFFIIGSGKWFSDRNLLFQGGVDRGSESGREGLVPLVTCLHVVCADSGEIASNAMAHHE